MEFQEVFITFLMGLGAILALVLTIALSSVMLAWSAKARRTLASIDSNPALLAFGNTPTGQYLHAQLQGLLPQFDQPTDKAIQDLLKVPLLKNLYNQGIIDAPTLSKGLSHFLGLTINLLDGKPSNLLEKEAYTGTAPLPTHLPPNPFPVGSPAWEYYGTIPPVVKTSVPVTLTPIATNNLASPGESEEDKDAAG